MEPVVAVTVTDSVLAVAIASVVINCAVQVFKVLAMRDRIPRALVEQWLPRLLALLMGATVGLSGFLPGDPTVQVLEGLAAAVQALINWWAVRSAGLVKGEGSR